MKNKTKKERQKEHNDQLIKRMKKGENLAAFDAELSFFPNRPIIKKDKKVMDKLYKPKE
jgi:hypothetical protein